MRIAILSYSHHGRGIGRIVRDQGHEIAGVMDAEEGPRRQLSEFFDCAGYAAAGPCLLHIPPPAGRDIKKHGLLVVAVVRCCLLSFGCRCLLLLL